MNPSKHVFPIRSTDLSALQARLYPLGVSGVTRDGRQICHREWTTRICRVLQCAAFIAACCASPARADEVSKQTKIDELFEVMHTEQSIPQTMQQIAAQLQPIFAAQAKKLNLPPDAAPKLEEMQKKMMAIVADRMSWQKMKPVYAKAYADTFTEEEIDGIIRFYMSPAGQALLKKSPLLTQSIVQSSQGMLGDLFAEIPKIAEETFKQLGQKAQ